MGRQTGYLFGFNAGIVSEEALQRVDQQVTRIAGEEQVNLIPRVLGAAYMRPGSQYLFGTKGGLQTRLIPFTFNVSTKALLELAPDGTMRPIVNDEVVSRVAVSTTISNGGFDSDLTGWTDADEGGAASAWATGGYMQLTGTGATRAVRYQSVTVAVGDQGKEHGARIVVKRGPVIFSIGTTTGGVEVLEDQFLGEGEHSIAFTPTVGTVYIRLSADRSYPVLVDSIAIEGAGDVTIPTPYTSIDQINRIQFEQSGDIIYLAESGAPPRKIERRSNRSWGLSRYMPIDGPFNNENVTETSITPSATSGQVTLTASRPLFKSGHVGALWQMTHGGQYINQTLAALDAASDAVNITGTFAAERTFGVTITPDGSWSGTWRVQRAFGAPVGWSDTATFGAGSYNNQALVDTFTNAVTFYRVIVEAYTAGSIQVEIQYANAQQVGVVQISAVASATSATAQVLKALGQVDSTPIWREGAWSDVREWPGAVALYDGRLWWGGKDRVYGSISDAYESFDLELEGDAGPIIRNVGSRGFERVLWILGLQRLIVGTAAEEISIRASNFDEPLTPTQFTARSASQRGSAEGIQAVRVDSIGIFAQRNRRRVYEMLYVVEAQDYASNDITRFVPEICEPGIVSAAVQRQPDTRVWFVLSDGTAALLLYERQEEALAWIKIEMTGADIESVVVLPGDEEDDVYLTVNRNSVRSIEKMAKLSEVVGGTLNKVMDGHVVYSGSPTTTITGLDHLEGLDVVVWADGAVLHDQGDMKTVSSGQITIASSSDVVVGVPYEGRFRSARLNYGAQLGVSLGKPQKITGAYLIMKDVGWEGVEVRSEGASWSGLPATYEGRPLTAGEVVGEYIHDLGVPGGGFRRDTQFEFRCAAPYPATFLGVSLDIETGEGLGGGPRDERDQ